MRRPRLRVADSAALAHQPEHRRNPGEQYSALQQHLAPMQLLKLQEQRIPLRRRLDRPHPPSQLRHPRTDGMLRHHGEEDHQHHTQRRRRHQRRKTASPQKSHHQEHDAANHPDHVHPPERKPNHRPGLIPARQNAKRPRRHHKTQKHIAPKPQAQTQKFNSPQKVRHRFTRKKLGTPDSQSLVCLTARSLSQSNPTRARTEPS
jgi:hypothetical protein